MLESEYTFSISPLVRLTLFCLYAGLTIPLPFLTQVTAAPIPAWLLWVGIGLGAIALYGALSERVTVDAEAIAVNYPGWVPQFFRQGWRLPWSEVKDLKMRTTGQGGLVYYFLSKSGAGYLLPMRIVGFKKLLEFVQTRTGIDTADIRPLSQPWMYLILLGCSFLLLLVDAWTVWTATHQGFLA
ncbi:MAG: hypothetical protein KME17_08565 [Cyanosarcina radialis HA8281-LM2]|nr:hypothetical protein [Cyanosarcina radialis HA8281-LM2]